MARPSIILGDWGTSSLRLFLVSESGEVLEQLHGLGVSLLEQSIDQAFTDYIADWQQRFDIKYCLLSGMVGSNIGWQSVPYMDCPAESLGLSQQLQTLNHHGLEILLVPGLKCINPLNHPDVMRGEEVQLLGLLETHAELSIGRHIICLPGTHCKWVLVEDSRIRSFFTAPTGELFDLINRKSTLCSGMLSSEKVGQQFIQGVQLAEQNNLLLQLFQLRSKNIISELSGEGQAELLSGMLLGSEVKSALQVVKDVIANSDDVIVVADEKLAERYALALNHFHISCRSICGEQISLAGLKTIAAHIETDRNGYAA